MKWKGQCYDNNKKGVMQEGERGKPFTEMIKGFLGIVRKGIQSI